MSVKVTNEAIRNLLTNLDEPIGAMGIVDALGYEYDAINEVCARLRGMEKRPNQRVASVPQDGRKYWYRVKKERPCGQ